MISFRLFRTFAAFLFFTSTVVFYLLYFNSFSPISYLYRYRDAHNLCEKNEICSNIAPGDFQNEYVLNGIIKLTQDNISENKISSSHPNLSAKDFQFSFKSTRVNGIPQDVEEIDYPSLTLNFTRIDGWPSEFPDDIFEYRERVLNSTFFNINSKWKAEIAPFTFHHRGRAEDYFLNNPDTREKAAILVLVRNSELYQLMHSIRQLEDRFNRKHHYPYIFLNDKPFSNKFMEMIARSTESNTTFSLIPKDHWSIPKKIDLIKTERGFLKLKKENIIYATSMSYRHMCRFNSGFFYKHPLLESLKYYWRLEPDIDFYCDIDYDPFTFMRKNNKMYSFVISLFELEKTIPSLWEHTLLFAKNASLESSLLSMFTSRSTSGHGSFRDSNNSNYNLCHFWSNFEIASLDFYRSKQYQDYFDYLDSTGNFFYERWGDAPIHSLAVGLFLNYSQVHYFRDIGYRHDGFARWPEPKLSLSNKCIVPSNIINNFDSESNMCLNSFLDYTEYNWTKIDTINALKNLHFSKTLKSGSNKYAFNVQKYRDIIGRG
ncbi:putative mannosyltransferase KTR3 [Smittium culicis]|uniref:Putative mannosyltransferase KTR3 n=1 Tax=Smittium culicis TaxID=133412 RepID=A0A1R1YQC3_9FUNG|nr:putative mannosyltransferase KTR3 [Smittium culicis]